MSDERPVVLVGFMGSGKSAVGRRLAAELGWTFVDSDAEVESRAGRAVAEIFAREGEARFREVEREVVANLARSKRIVVALGGGAYGVAATRTALRGATRTVWLDASLAACGARVGEGRGRPLWRHDDPIALRALFERRRSAYALACHQIDASGPVEGVVQVLVSVLAQNSH